MKPLAETPRGTLVLALALAFTPPGARAQSFTLEQVLSSPFPSDLIGYAGGGKFAWAQDDEGKRNVWAADAPDFRPRKLTPYDADDGQEIGSVAFTPDGRAVVYVRGQGPNRRGEVPNPLSWAEWPEQAV